MIAASSERPPSCTLIVHMVQPFVCPGVRWSRNQRCIAEPGSVAVLGGAVDLRGRVVCGRSLPVPESSFPPGFNDGHVGVHDHVGAGRCLDHGAAAVVIPVRMRCPSEGP